jgi:hypothetical protein
MKHLNLPEPIAAYFDADAQGSAAVARCFTHDGRVLDEAKTHSGRAAIEAWKAHASATYTYSAKPHTLEQQGHDYVVTAHVAGNFPGSPVDLRHRFTLERGLVATLEIAP